MCLHFRVGTSHPLIGAIPPAETIDRPSGLKRTQSTDMLWPWSAAIGFRLTTSQILSAVPSVVQSSFPSGLKSRNLSSILPSVVRAATIAPVETFHKLIPRPPPEVARVSPSG